MGGPSVRGEMLKLGAVERVEIVMVPRIINGGTPIWTFGTSREQDFQQVPMELIDCRTYENGVLALSYAVQRSR
jgi:riboflavin biosynthesis pyrimidine reductase